MNVLRVKSRCLITEQKSRLLELCRIFGGILQCDFLVFKIIEFVQSLNSSQVLSLTAGDIEYS